MNSPNELKKDFKYWEITKDLIEQCIDIMLNLRQSGHPGGSRSKVYAMVATLLSGAMKWDIRDAGKRYGDRYVLVAGHCNPVVYATLAVLNEAMRIKYAQTSDSKYQNLKGPEYQLVWEDLLSLRQNKGLPGHAEMEGKTLFFKANTGPSGHGSPFAAGAALALKFADVPEVKVFAFEGEGGLTTGASHETINSAWGLGLGNLVYFLDWNDFGIDDRPFSSIVYGGPNDWFGSHGWHVEGAEDGENWEELSEAYYRLLVKNTDPNIPKAIFSKTRKGRGYYIYDHKSHGAAHKRNSDLFWKTKEDFSNTYNVEFSGFGDVAEKSWEGQVDQAKLMFSTVFTVMKNNQEYVDFLADRLVSLGDSVPQEITSCRISKNNSKNYSEFCDINKLPDKIFVEPGVKAPNRVGFSKYASYLNTSFEKKYGRPLVLAMSADLADSTNISGFAKEYDSEKNKGLYDKTKNPTSPLFPQGITEFTNAGMMAGAATVNFSKDPYEVFNGFFGAASTYGSFSYLKYGPLRLFSQIAQDSDLKVGKVIWVVGHSGPETAEDSRTHFGIFAPGVTQLFPDGHIINLHPWEHNEVAPALATALNTDVPLIKQMLKFWQFNDDEMEDYLPEIYWTDEEKKLGDDIIYEAARDSEFGCLLISDRFGQDDKTFNSETFQKHHEKLTLLLHENDYPYFYYSYKPIKELGFQFNKLLDLRHIDLRIQLYIKSKAKLNLGIQCGTTQCITRYSNCISIQRQFPIGSNIIEGETLV